MDFILDEAEEDSQMLQFSDEEEIEDDFGDFINDEEISEEGVRFYQERDTLDLNDYPKFNGQTRDPREAIFEDNESFFGEDSQPELQKLQWKGKMLILTSLRGLKNMQKSLKIP